MHLSHFRGMSFLMFWHLKEVFWKSKCILVTADKLHSWCSSLSLLRNFLLDVKPFEGFILMFKLSIFLLRNFLPNVQTYDGRIYCMFKYILATSEGFSFWYSFMWRIICLVIHLSSFWWNSFLKFSHLMEVLFGYPNASWNDNGVISKWSDISWGISFLIFSFTFFLFT